MATIINIIEKVRRAGYAVPGEFEDYEVHVIRKPDESVVSQLGWKWCLLPKEGASEEVLEDLMMIGGKETAKQTSKRRIEITEVRPKFLELRTVSATENALNKFDTTATKPAEEAAVPAPQPAGWDDRINQRRDRRMKGKAT